MQAYMTYTTQGKDDKAIEAFCSLTKVNLFKNLKDKKVIKSNKNFRILKFVDKK